MSVLPESWNPIAETLGYRNEEHMLRDLYEEQNFSISEIAKRLGFAQNNVRRRLLICGMQLRERGGRNNLGNRVLSELTDEQLSQDPRKVAAECNVHISTVFKEKRRRGLKCCSPPLLRVTASEDTASQDTNSASPSNVSETGDTSISTEEELMQEIRLYLTTEPTKEI